MTLAQLSDELHDLISLAYLLDLAVDGLIDSRDSRALSAFNQPFIKRLEAVKDAIEQLREAEKQEGGQ